MIVPAGVALARAILYLRRARSCSTSVAAVAPHLRAVCIHFCDRLLFFSSSFSLSLHFSSLLSLALARPIALSAGIEATERATLLL